MGGIDTFILWKESAAMAADAIEVSRKTKGPGAAKAADQFRRAAESVPHNIAEGHGRGVSQSCLNFLRIAFGSLQEMESQLRVGRLAGRWPEEDIDRLMDRLIRVRFLLVRFRQSVERRLNPPEPDASPDPPEPPQPPEPPHPP